LRGVKRDRISPLRDVVARNVRRLRAERGISQEELADRSGLHRTNVSKLERSLHAVSIDTLYWIGKALGVTAEDLLKR
jgi:transcriptional regulator with XRE-family HTH domain